MTLEMNVGLILKCVAVLYINIDHKQVKPWPIFPVSYIPGIWIIRYKLRRKIRQPIYMCVYKHSYIETTTFKNWVIHYSSQQ